jgi:hypothetical protein
MEKPEEELKKTQIAEKIFMYTFPPSYTPRIEQNVFVLVNRHRAVITDSST